jgi:hypothetical protein
MTRRCLRAVTFVVAALFASGTPLAAAAHDLPFWRAIVRDRYAPPPGSDVPALGGELIDLLASPDPEARDEIAYSTLASWICQKKIIDASALRSMTDRLLESLSVRVGERDNDSIFRRSFSALTLSVIVARDNADPFLDAAGWRRIESAALAYLSAERDVRGYEPEKGWMHSAAHTADLLKFLARSRFLELADQQRLLDAVGAKLVTTPVVFSFGEDERFAHALLSLVARRDFDHAAFFAWLKQAKPAVQAHPTIPQLQAIQNWKNVLAKLEVLLSNDPPPADAAGAARAALRQELKDLF